ncbi:MAG: hypothetical protein NC078_02130 [Ruminococcus sp.]|nr:hypothetical protein [Ruminococcus sp.]
MKLKEICLGAVFALAVMLAGCSGEGEDASETVTESVGESITETVPESVSESVTEKSVQYMEHIRAFITSNVYDDPEMYGVKIIKSSDELEEYINGYEITDRREELAEYAETVDFGKEVIASKTVWLSSGSYGFDFYFTEVKNGMVVFNYELTESEYGMTDNEAVLFMFARIPEELVDTDSDWRYYSKHLMGFKTSYDMNKYSGYSEEKILRSPDELKEFGEQCGREGDIEAYARNVDFEKEAVAVSMVCLTSGGYDFTFNGVYVNEGEVLFDYALIGSDRAMTADMATLYLLAVIPGE